MTNSNRTRTGEPIFIGAAWFLMGFNVSKALYYSYYISQMSSDLGVGAAAPIFNSAIFGFGRLLIAAAYLLYTAVTNRWFFVMLTPSSSSYPDG